jgi:signal transduction histidine kinase
MSSASDPLAAVQRRLDRERAARREAENIAERVTAEFYRVNSELEMLNESLREFIAVTAHDLRGPLTVMLGMTSTLSKRWADLGEDRRTDFLATIERQGRRLARLIDDLLTASKIEAGALEIVAEVVPMREAFTDLMGDFDDRSDEVKWTTEDVHALVDRDHLQRILTNYVRNALTYGGPPVEVHTRDTGSWVEILVRDGGQGVPDELVPKLFGKFVRGATSHEKGGTGLGLSIVRGLAHANGGETWYERNQPNGSCFGVRLRKHVAA